MTIFNIAIEYYLLVAAVAFGASVIGGVTGYGTGLLLPPILLPIIGPHAVVPVIAVSAVFTNASRVVAFWREIDRKRVLAITLIALPSSILGAYVYTLLSGAAITVIIGLVLVLMVPLRSLFMRRHGHLGTRGLMMGAGLYGLFNGSMSGVGVMLISLLLAAGMHGMAVIATDAAISVMLGFAKVTVFQTGGLLALSHWVMAVLIGLCSLPGAFFAKHLLTRLPGRAHILMLDGVVVLGGLLMVARGIGFL